MRQGGVEQTGAFARIASDYLAAGLAPLPCGAGHDGKGPLVRWRPFVEQPPSAATIARWRAAHPAANIGTVTGRASGLTVIDVDAPELIPMALSRFGDTPLLTRTPRGGAHLFYRHAGEASATKIEGVAIDVRGARGFLVLPPSRSPAGVPYSIERGALDAPTLDMLPRINASAMPQRQITPAQPNRGPQRGERNNALFAALREAVVERRRQGRPFETREELQFYADCLNERFGEPLDGGSVAGTVGSVWKYNIENRILVAGMGRVMLSEADIRLPADELKLKAVLRFHHPDPRKPFAIGTEAMPALLAWGRNRLRKARDGLIRLGVLERLHQGGQGKHDPAIYRWRS